jgi:demethylmenaquinone methyltransferase/2-methoxy-6-polyprenyl-1,4-benzoquinol methylase
MSVWDKKRDTMHRYDVTAQIYDMRYGEEQTAKMEAALRHLKIEAYMILDSGCGTGILFNHVADKARMTIGLDFSRKTLLKAKERAKNHVGLNLVRADADNMPLRDNIFDRVFAMTLIQNTPDPMETLNEIRRVAKDNALIVVTGLKKIFCQHTLERLLKNAGLNIVAMENEDLKCYVAICTWAS